MTTCNSIFVLILIYITHIKICTSSLQCSTISQSQCIIDCNDPFSCRNGLFNASKIDNKLNIELQCNGSYSCHFFSFYGALSTNISTTIFCNGKRSCASSIFYLSNFNTIIYSGADDSMIDSEIIHAIDSPVSISPNLQINVLDACSSLISMICFDEISKCYITCGNKNIEILSNWFQLIIDSHECIEQQFTSSCYGKQEISRNIKCENNQITNNNNSFHNVILWNIQSSNNDNCSLTSGISTYSETLKCNDYSKCNIICTSQSNISFIPNQCNDNTALIDGHISKWLFVDCFNKSCSNLDVICPKNSVCELYCHHNSFCNNLHLHINDNYTNLYVECTSGSTCSHITIHGDESSKITVNCTDAICNNFLIFAKYSSYLKLYSISNSIIDAEYAHLIKLSCGANNNQCWNTDLFADNALYFNLIANGNMAVKNISIYADYAENVIISSEKQLGIRDSYVSALHSNNFQMSCYGGYGEITCYNIDLYVLPFGTSLLCEGTGCQQINLHLYSNDTDYNTDWLQINGCGACDNVIKCIDAWTIYCQVNESDIFDGTYINDTCYDDNFVNYINDKFMIDTTQCKYAITDAPTSDPTSNPIEYFPVETDALSNNLISEMSFILAIITISVCGIITLISIYYLGKHVFLLIQTKYLSTYYLYQNRPYIFILWCCIFAEIFIFISMYWCSIKLILFYHFSFNYCNVAYPTENHSKICNEDALCSTKWQLLLQYENNDCGLDLVKYFFLFVWQFVFLILFLIEVFRVITVRRGFGSKAGSYYPLLNLGNYPDYCDLFNANCICCMALCCPPTSLQIVKPRVEHVREHPIWDIEKESVLQSWQMRFYERVYWKRHFWLGTRDFCNCWGYIFDHILRYGICVSVALWFYIVYYDIDTIDDFQLYSDQNNDFALTWYDFIPFVILLIIKILLQISYFIGPKYGELDRKHDEAWFIEKTLTEIFGIDVGKIIRTYLPFFYDKTQCPEHLLLGTIANVNEYFLNDHDNHGFGNDLTTLSIANLRQYNNVNLRQPRYPNNRRIELQVMHRPHRIHTSHPMPIGMRNNDAKYDDDSATTDTYTGSDSYTDTETFSSSKVGFHNNNEVKMFISAATYRNHNHHYIDDGNQHERYYIPSIPTIPSIATYNQINAPPPPSLPQINMGETMNHYYQKPNGHLEVTHISNNELERRRIELFKSSMYQNSTDIEAEEKAQQPLQQSYIDNEETETESVLDYVSSTEKLNRTNSSTDKPTHESDHSDKSTTSTYIE